MGDSELGEPVYRPELNKGLGGTIELTDEYLFPVELPARKVRTILEDQADEDTAIKGNQSPFFSLEVGDAEQYDLLHTYGEDEPVDAVAVYNSSEEEVVGFYDIDELTE